MRFPRVPFPNLRDLCVPRRDKVYSENYPMEQVAPFPHSMKDGEYLEPGRGRDQIWHARLLAGGGGHRLPFFHPSSLPLLSGSLRPVQVTVFGFIFCWARLSPGRGGGREKRRGEGTALSAQSQAPLLLPSWSRLPPFPGGTSSWAQWGPRPRWDLLPWHRTSRSV